MKKIYVFVMTLFIISACMDSSNETTEANVAIVQQYLDAVANNDYTAMETALADNYMGLGPSVGDTTNRENALASWKWNSENLYESVVYEFSEILPTTVKEGPAAGDWVSNWSYLTINYKDGRGPVNLWINAVYKIENGKIARSRTFYNEADVMAQLGYRIYPPLTVPDTTTNN